VQLGRRFDLHHPRVVAGRLAYPHLPVGVRTVLRAADLPGYVLSDAEPTGGKTPPARH
jgi:hypothetical protein